MEMPRKADCFIEPRWLKKIFIADFFIAALSPGFSNAATLYINIYGVVGNGTGGNDLPE